MAFVANARMYAIGDGAAAAWTKLFEWLSMKSGVPLEIIAHKFPEPLSSLWERRDLAAAFMCGLPFSGWEPRPKPVAAPVPSGARYGGKPVYVSDLIVRVDAPFQRLEYTFGGRVGYTVEDSHSGYNALRHHLLPFRTRERPKLYAEVKGGYMAPRRIIEAVIAGEIDIGPVDGYAMDLARKHLPELAAQVRVIATTDAAPIPFLIANPDCPDEIIAKLRKTLLDFGVSSETAELREALCLSGFAAVVEGDYRLHREWVREAVEAGYGEIG